MNKIFSVVISLLSVSVVWAHVGEEVEEHAADAIPTGPAIGSWIFTGILAAAIVGLLVWVMVKK